MSGGQDAAIADPNMSREDAEQLAAVEYERQVAHPMPPNWDKRPRFRPALDCATVLGGWDVSSGKSRIKLHRRPKRMTNDYDERELVECYASIRSFLDVRLRTAIFFLIVTISIIGLSLQYTSSLLLVVAAGVLYFFHRADMLIRYHLGSYLFVGYIIERRMGREKGVITMHILSHSKGKQIIDQLELWDKIPVEQAGKEIRANFLKPFGFRGEMPDRLTFLAIGFCIVGALITYLMGWDWIIQSTLPPPASGSGG